MSVFGGPHDARGTAAAFAQSPGAQLIGGEAVPVDLRVARIGSRAIAAIIDFALEILALALVDAVLVNVAHVDSAALRALTITTFVLAFLGYPVIAETAWSGRTVGKVVMGLRAARDDGGPVRFRHSLVRGLLGFFVEKPGITLGLAAVISSLLSTRGKRLGDLLGGTVVLQVRLPVSGAYLPGMPPALAGWATTLDLSRFDDALALQCRQFLGRAGQLTEAARERLGTSLVASVQSVVTPPPPLGTPGWAYLAAVLAERRRREEVRLAGAWAAQPPAVPLPPRPAADSAEMLKGANAAAETGHSGGFVPPA